MTVGTDNIVSLCLSVGGVWVGVFGGVDFAWGLSLCFDVATFFSARLVKHVGPSLPPPCCGRSSICLGLLVLAVVLLVVLLSTHGAVVPGHRTAALCLGSLLCCIRSV